MALVKVVSYFYPLYEVKNYADTLPQESEQSNETPSLVPFDLFGDHSHASDNQPYDSPYATSIEIPKSRIPQRGSSAEVVAQLIRDELDLDCRPSLNLAR